MSKLLQKLVFISAITQRELSDAVLKVYADTLLSQLTEDEAILACDVWIRKSKTNFMPTPAQLIEHVRPATTDRGEAILLATRLNEVAMKRGTSWADDAVYINGEPKYMGQPGEYFPTWDEACVSLLGSAAYEVIRRMGGWKRACYSFFESDHAVVRAQVRDLAETCLIKARSGTLDQTLSLPGPNQNLVKEFNLVKDLNQVIGSKT